MSADKNSVFCCNECGDDDSGGGGIGGWSIKTELWEKYGNGKGMLCMKCFEKRSGRRLIAMDFCVGSTDNKTNSIVQAIIHEYYT